MRNAKSKRGFSTAEMLLATLILSLSMMLLSNGAAVIQRIYRRTLAATDAQMILSQTEINLRNDLSAAEEYRTDNGDVTLYRVSSYWYRLTVNEGVLYKERFSSPPQPDETGSLEQISLKNVRRLADLKIPAAPTIRFSYDCFQVYGLRVEYTDNRNQTAILCGETLPDDLDNAPAQFVIRALQSVTS